MPETAPTPAKPTPADLDAFDLDAFIAGVVQPSKVVAISQNRALGQQVIEAMQAVTDLEQAEKSAQAEGRSSKRRAATVESPQLEQAREHLADLQAQSANTFIFVRVEGLSRSVREQAVKDAAGDQTVYNQSVLAHTAKIYTLDPRTHDDALGRLLTLEQWGELAEAIGFLQWDAILNALAEVTAVGVSPDFSQPASHSPAGGTSGKS